MTWRGRNGKVRLSGDELAKLNRPTNHRRDGLRNIWGRGRGRGREPGVEGRSGFMGTSPVNRGQGSAEPAAPIARPYGAQAE